MLINKTIWIVAGGTGGHISPGVALAHHFSINNKVIFFTLSRNEYYNDILQLKNNSPNIQVIIHDSPKIPKSITQLIYFIKQQIKNFFLFQGVKKMSPPECTIAMGGYSCFSLLLWNVILFKRYFLCEQNAVLGIITKLFAFRAKKVFLSFPIKNVSTQKFILTGNPIRQLFYTVKPKISKLNMNHILIIGGSQGAKDLNTLYILLKENLFFKKYRFTVITGKQDYSYIQKDARKKDTILPFSNEIHLLMHNADVIISRAGSGILFELLYLQKVSILIPFPHATKNHQLKNAQHFKNLNFCELIHPFQRDTITQQMKGLLLDKKKINRIQNSMKQYSSNYMHSLDNIDRNIATSL